jgi:(2Fe-2S) ferredoxin
MRLSPFLPRLHFFVCANRRPLDSSLGPGCGSSGDAVFDALKEGVAARNRFSDVWVTKTECIGLCPRDGATVALYEGLERGTGRIFTEVHASEARTLLEEELARTPLVPDRGDREPRGP